MKLSHREFAGVVGNTLASPEVKGLLKKISPGRSPALEKFGQTYRRTAHFNLPKLGLRLQFELPMNKTAMPANARHLRLTRIDFWRKNTAMGMPFAFDGDLPCGMRFSEAPKVVFKKAGRPASIAKTFNSMICTWPGQAPGLRAVFTKRGPKSQFRLALLSYDGGLSPAARHDATGPRAGRRR